MRKFDYTRVIILIISLLILIAGFVIPNENIAISIFISAAIIALVVLDKNTPSIVKLSEDNPKIKTFRFLNRLTLFVVILSYILVVLSPVEKLHASNNKDVLTIALISIFMMVFGNVSPKIPFNRYLGLRLPWTIRDEQTWKIAHRILGYISFPIALIMFISSFFVNSDKVGVIGIFTWVIIPSLYSFVFYYKKIKG